MGSADHTTTVSSEGRVRLPKAVRDQVRWGVGTRLTVKATADGVLLKPLELKPAERLFAPTRPEDVFGSLRYVGKPRTIEEMDAGITAEIERRRARGRY